MQYVVHYRYDDARKTPGSCRTDYPLEVGEILYAGDGRATVRSCRPDLSVDNTFRANARALRLLGSAK